MSLPFSSLQYVQCSGAVPGKNYAAPGRVIAVSYNGIWLRAANAPLTASVAGNQITLNFSTMQGDSIYAFCVF